MALFGKSKKKVTTESHAQRKAEEAEYRKGLDEDFKKYEGKEIIFIPKKCPKCGQLLSVRELGVWGYYCHDCMFWWGTYDPYPIVRETRKAEKKK